MDRDAEVSISLAVERLALALGDAGAVPRGELIRALERAAERLRVGAPIGVPPSDVLSQAEAARLVGVSRQAVNQWVRKGILQSYTSTDGNGRRAPLVSLSEITIAANRGRAQPFSPTLRQQLGEFLERVGADAPASSLPAEIAAGLEAGLSDQRAEDAARVLREFLIAAMGIAGRQQEFTGAGVRMLSSLQPNIVVDTDTDLGQLLATLGLLIRSADGRQGFDSPGAAILGLLGAATVGARLASPLAPAGERVAACAEDIWGEEWVRRLFDVAYHADELVAPLMTRYPAALVYLGCNRFMRQAQTDGVSITYARSPGAMLPQSYHGAPVLSELLSGARQANQPWQFRKGTAAIRTALEGSAKSPFRVFNFEYGLFDSSIHGIRRYCFSITRAREELTDFTSQLPQADQAAYRELALETLAHVLEKPFVEMTAVEPPAQFDWWKDHIIRSSPRETLIGLRGEKARSTAHALLVRASVLPQILESGAEEADLREHLRVYVKNLSFDITDERYRDDLNRGVTRMIKKGGEELSSGAARMLAASMLEEMSA